MTTLIPVSEWKQCIVRGIRSALQAFTFLVGGGTVVAYIREMSIRSADGLNLPSTGVVLYDAALYSLVFGVLVTVWNAIEFWLGADIRAPKLRA